MDTCYRRKIKQLVKIVNYLKTDTNLKLRERIKNV